MAKSVPDYCPFVGVGGKIIVRCYVLDVCSLGHSGEADLLAEKIAPRYVRKAQKLHSRERALTQLGVGALLSRVLNITSDKALSVDEYGKPFLAAGDHEIGITHAGNLAVLAVSSCAVGIDVQPLPDAVDRRHLLAIERAYGNRFNKPGALTPLRFCELWTQVEAAVKLDGRGLCVDPRENPQIFDGVHFHTLEHKRHIITLATYQPSTIEIQSV